MNYKVVINARDTQKFRVHQIFYDETSKAALDRDFIPLDNTSNLRPDWFEFWVILNYLRTNQLEPSAWYGFLSPKFTAKVGVSSQRLYETLREIDSTHDVALFSPHIDQIIYFKNVFMQGEFWCPGLATLTKKFITSAGIDADLDNLICHSNNSCFSNYIVAKASFWNRWRQVAEAFFRFAEDQTTETGRAVSSLTQYNQGTGPMKTFIQERLSALVLGNGDWRVFNIPLTYALRFHPPEVSELLIAVDVLKRRISLRTKNALEPALTELLAQLRFDVQSLSVRRAAEAVTSRG